MAFKLKSNVWRGVGLFLICWLVLSMLLVTFGTSCQVPVRPEKPTSEDYGGIEGMITDVNGTPVSGMRVSIVSGTTGFPEIAAITNETGYYAIGSVPPGSFEIAVHDQEGNRVGLGSVTVRGGETSTLNFIIAIEAVGEEIPGEPTPAEI